MRPSVGQQTFKTASKTMYPFEDYSAEIVYHAGSRCYAFKDCLNASIIPADSVPRLADRLQGRDLALMAACRPTLTKEQNIACNRMLRTLLWEQGVGVYQLVGYWVAVPEATQWAAERCYLAARPQTMQAGAFESLLQACLAAGGEAQGAVLLRRGAACCVLHPNGEPELLDGGELTLPQLAQAYARHVRHRDAPFPFRWAGCEEPATNLGRQMFARHHIYYA